MTILKDSNNESPIDPKTRSKDEISPSKKAGGVEEHVLALQTAMENLYEKSEEMEWDDKYKQLLGVLAEKNLMNFMAGVDICNSFLLKSLQYNRKLIETRLVELMQPVLNKIDSTNKRVKIKCRELVLSFWKTSIETKDWLHTHLATYLVAPEQKKLFVGAVAIFQDVLAYLNEKKVTDFRIIEEGLGVDLEKLVKLTSAELSNKLQQVRKISQELLVKITDIAAAQTDKTFQRKFITALETSLKPLKAAVRDKVLEPLNKSIVAKLKKVSEEKTTPEKGAAAEEDKLIYAEPLSADLKAQLSEVLKYFSENVTQCLYSQNWASRSAGLNKIKEELIFATVGETGGSTGEAGGSPQRNVNTQGVGLAKSTEAWVTILKHVLEDPVLKIYIDGLDLLKEVLILFKKYLCGRDEFAKATDPLIIAVISKLVLLSLFFACSHTNQSKTVGRSKAKNT